MINLSVVIITFNEERNIARCLESVKDIADEMVVVDSFSTDNTRKIAESFGAKVIEHPFEGHIQQKNYAITQATYPHQLSLDADEALTEELRQEIKKVKENWQSDGYRMNRLSNYCGQWIRHGGWYPDTKLRLFDSRKGAWGGTNPHDIFQMGKNSRIGFLKGDFLHFTYYSLKEHLDVSYRYADIMAGEMLKKNKKVGFLKKFASPFIKFLKIYFLKRGFLDGGLGLMIAWTAAYSTFLKYELYSQKRKNQHEK